MKNSWIEIMSSALLGTDKKPLTIQALPQNIKTELVAMGKISAEASLLTSAALLHFYTNSGTQPEKINNITFNHIAEHKQYIGLKTKKIFLQIMESSYYEKEYLLLLWLEKVIQQNKIASPDLVLTLINLGVECSKNTKKKILAILGERAKAILPLKPNFNIKELQYNATDQWKEGSPEDRRAFISELRCKDVDQSLSLISTDWTTETIVFKKSIIEILSEQTQVPELTFLTSLYEKEFEAKQNEKKTVTECRSLVAKVLLKDKQSKLHQSTLKQLQSYIGFEKKSGFIGILSGGKRKIFQLPTEPDTFFNAENLFKTYGFDTKNPDPALYITDVMYWFSQLLEIIPIGVFMTLLEKDVKDTFEYLTSHNDFIVKIEGKKVSVLKDNLIENVKNYRNQEVLQFILQSDTDDQKYTLLKYFDTNFFEEYVIKEKLFFGDHIIAQHPAKNEDWSPYFSVKMLEATYKSIVMEKRLYHDKINQSMAKHLHISTITRLEELYQSAVNDQFKEIWIKNVYQPTKTSINIKSSINQISNITENE